MDDLGDMTLEMFKLWSLNALRVFLSRRNKSVNGNFEELSARAFCAWEEKIPIDEKSEQGEQRLLAEYKKKLILNGDVIPDPFSLTSGWKGEKSAIRSWPSVYVTDISAFLNCRAPKEVVHRLLNEYKEGKAYRYFDCEWVKEIFIHDIHSNSDKCIMKAKVTPSQSINSKNYDVWVIVRKDGDSPGGEVLSGYCSCTAGMLGVCNHIAGVLFRIEHAVKMGITKSSSTSLPCEWNIPKLKTVVKPAKVSDLSWKKSSYMTNEKDNERDRERFTRKKEFTPLSKSQTDEVKDDDLIRNKLYNLLKTDIPNSTFVLMQEKKRFTVEKPDIPPSLVSIAESLKLNGEITREKYMDKIQLDVNQCDDLKRATIDQSHSEAWREQRKGRLTASIFQRVCSRVNTMRKDESADPTALLETVMGRKECRPTHAMKHGISLEPYAKRVYTQAMKKDHVKFKNSDSGLSVYQDKPYIAASADLEVECECCGQGLCEIKCPVSIKDTKPSEFNLSYILKEGEKLCLQKTHPYYYQIQGQMGILGRRYCDLFVYTFHGQLQIRVDFDNTFWEMVREKLSWFWNQYVLPELLCPTTCTSTNTNSIHAVNDHQTSAAVATTSATNFPPVPMLIDPPILVTVNVPRVRRPLLPLDIGNTPKKRRQALTKQPIYLCGICGIDCIDEPQTDDDQSVQCDVCGMWFHYVCAGVTNASLTESDEWACVKCTSESG